MGIKLVQGAKTVTVTNQIPPMPGVTVPFSYGLAVGPNGDWVDYGSGPFSWDEDSGTYRRWNPRPIQIGDDTFWLPAWDVFQFNANGTVTYVSALGTAQFGTFTPCP